MAGGKDMSLPVFIPLNVVLNYAFVLFLFSAPGSHTQWTIVHHFSHNCEMRAVGDLSHAVDDCPSFLSQL